MKESFHALGDLQFSLDLKIELARKAKERMFKQFVVSLLIFGDTEAALPSDFAEICHTLEVAILGGTNASTKLEASEAVLDCLLVVLEVADEIGLRNTTVLLDAVADVAFAEVKGRSVPTRSIGSILLLAEEANRALAKTDPPQFSSSRTQFPKSALKFCDFRKSA